MTNEFIREDRYIVFKVSDLGNSTKGDEIRRLAREHTEQRTLKGKKRLECVVVEKDWPEYEPTWKAIEARVTGAQPAPSVPREAISEMLTQLMDIAASNGANSVSMPDEYVEVAAWLCGIPAQPAPEAWLPVPDKHPTYAPVDLLLADGSVLCGCLPQSDGDYWWQGPSGEVFIDPRYAPVTHWRLSAPETKP